MNKLTTDDQFEAAADHVSAVAGSELKAFVERIERMNEEIKEAQDGRKEIYAEAKARGFDVKTLRRVVSERAKDSDARQEADAMFDLYAGILGLR